MPELPQYFAQFAPDHLLQVVFIALNGLIVFGGMAVQRARSARKDDADKLDESKLPVLRWFGCNYQAVLFILIQLSGFVVGLAFGLQLWLLLRLAILGTVWLCIAYGSRRIGDRFWGSSLSMAAYIIAGALLVPELGRMVMDLEGFRIQIGALSISAFNILKGVGVLLLALWLGFAVSKFIDARIRRTSGISPSLKVLISKVLRIAILVVALLAGIDSMGIDITVLTLLGGGLGLGLGFGLQKVVANLVSGFILLLDRSIKPGDVIEIDNTYGWINNLNARYVSIVTRDGKEHLIPNEDLITQRVVNWSHSDNNVRVRLGFGVSYNADVHKVREMAEEIARKSPRVLETPPPRCLMVGFGESSVDFELRFWICDPDHGIGNMRSQIYFDLWDAFKEHAIEIPFPQRDLHLRSADTLRVELRRPPQAE